MESHPSYLALSTLLSKYPRAGGSLFQVYNDLLLAQQWTDVEVIDLTTCSRGAIRGRRPKTDLVLHVVPCSLAESISTSWLFAAFKELGNISEVYLAITSDEASIVYYKISAGIVKPPVESSKSITLNTKRETRLKSSRGAGVSYGGASISKPIWKAGQELMEVSCSPYLGLKIPIYKP